MLFIGFLVDQKKQSSTVKSYLSALRAILKDDDVKLNEDLLLISSLTQACSYTNDRARTRLPIQKTLSVILKQVETHFTEMNQPYLAILHKTMFSTMYFGLLRISEVTKGAHPVLAKEVHIGFNKKKMLFILRTSKTHWYGNKPQLVKISSVQSKHQTHSSQAKNVKDENYCPCPFELLQLFAQIHGPYHKDDNPFFIFADGSPIKPVHLRKCLKKVIKEAGFDEKFYDSHSLRTGRTCDLLKLGLSVETIKKIGRWKSNAVFRYLKYYAK